MHPRHPLQLDVGIAPQENDPQEYTARPRPNNHSHLTTLQAQSSSSYPSSSSQPSTSSSSSLAPGIPRGLSRPLTHQEQERLAHLDRLKFFLATAPSRWSTSPSGNDNQQQQQHAHSPSHPALNRFLLPSQEFVTCVLWNGLYHITGTDIVRALVFRFEAFGRPVRNMKKFEEGVFSDLRNLKPGQDASLEEPKSTFLDLLFKYQCIRTQKKQKVFYWLSVPHDRLFLDALERDLKREKIGLEPTTVVVGEPALSFVYDTTFKRSLYDQFVSAAGGKEGEGDLERALRSLDTPSGDASSSSAAVTEDEGAEGSSSGISDVEGHGQNTIRSSRTKKRLSGNGTPFFQMISLFEGSPSYKQRRKKANRPSPLTVGNGVDAYNSYGGSGVPVGGMGIAMPQLPSSAPLARPFAPIEARGRFLDRSTRYPTSRNGSSLSSERYPYNYGYDGAQYANGDSMIKQEPVSAADLFMAQARGELHPPRHGASLSSNPPSTNDQGYVSKRHSYSGTGTSYGGVPEGALDPATMGAWYEEKFSVAGGKAIESQRSHSSQGFASRDQNGDDVEGGFRDVTNMSSHSRSERMTTKAYACPLMSCEKLFRGMDDLKRHMETHSPKGKGGEGEGGIGFEMMNVSEWINQTMDDEPVEDRANEGNDIDMVDHASAIARSQSQGTSGGVGVPLNMFGGMSVGMGGISTGVVQPDGGEMSLEMCEVELDGDVVDVPGDEVGLVRVLESGSGDEGYDTTFSYNVTNGSGSDYEGSYGYSGNVSNIGVPRTSHTNSSRPSSAVFDHAIYDSLPAGSVSAPSHTLAFDRTASYTNSLGYDARSDDGSLSSSYSSTSAIHSVRPSTQHTHSMDSAMGANPSMLLGSGLNDSLNGGPVRRYRSMTPNLYGSRHGRPLTSAGPYSGNGGRISPGSTTDLSSIANVGYHPYRSSSGHGGSVSAANSAHSSPATRHITLPPRSSSRASSLVRPASSASMYTGDMFSRSESPAMMTDSPARFAVELPTMGSPAMFAGHNIHPHAQTMPAANDSTYANMSSGYLGRGHGFNMEAGPGYYPQHVSTL